jgi:hypothetical protein
MQDAIASPPPLPPQVDPYAPPRENPVVVDQTPGELEERVMRGYRFMTIPYVVSVMILSFRRSMGGVHEVNTGEWPMGQVIGATFITCLFGWWGIPFGILWTILSLFYLWRGGRDCTREILTQALGAQEAKRILAAAPRPKPPASIWLVRLVILIPVGLFVALVVSIINSSDA